jgi:hypothetical protein
MKFHMTLSRRMIAVAATMIAGLAISSTAYAATSSGTARAATAIPKCTAADLGVWVAIDQGNGAAGTIYYPLQFTNLSGHTCELDGYPGVSAIGDNGQQLGSPANWSPVVRAQVVLLAPGATAHTLLGYHDVAVSTEPSCDPVSNAGLLSVIPPGQSTATDAEFSIEACSRPGVIYMTIIQPIQPGPGTIYSS